MKHFQIYVSRVQEPLDPNRIKIYWHQDLPGDPFAIEPLKNEGWKNFDFFVFNSTWQQSVFQGAFNIPFWKSTVLQNAIDPIPNHKKVVKGGKVNLIYHTTPHRGLELLVPVFNKLYETDKDIELDVYSSFSIYGWSDRNKPYEKLFDTCKESPGINYHGFKPNKEIRSALEKSHIYAYPSIWTESSCISLMEAMSAKNICVHSNLGALWDTSGHITRMYQFDDDATVHANRFMFMLKQAINDVRNNNVGDETKLVKTYADFRFSWSKRHEEWEQLLKDLVILKEQNLLNSRQNKQMFVYRT